MRGSFFPIMVLALALVTLAGTALGQDSPPAAQGYVFVAPGVIRSNGNSTGSLHFGGGGEFFLVRGLAAGGEIGYLTPWRDFSNGIGIFSANGSYHFNRDAEPSVSPFLTAGYSRAFGQGGANMVNFGAGMNWWFKRGLGLRLEVRDHVPTTGNGHMLGFRVGLSFR